ncbi:MAG: sugar phosphate nucleotidyltransferase, partial [Nanoarchaeota archaeon]
IITGWRKHSVLDYFGSGENFGVDISYIVQDEMLGLADAIGRVRKFVDESFVVGLGDDIFWPVSCMKDIVDFHEEKKSSATLSIEEVSSSEVEKYGIVKIDKDYRVIDLVEKPPASKAPSRFAIAGIYVFTPEIFDAIQKTRPGKNNELQLTDSIKLLVDSGKPVYSKKLNGHRITIGSIDELRKANEFFVYMNSKKYP